MNPSTSKVGNIPVILGYIPDVVFSGVGGVSSQFRFPGNVNHWTDAPRRQPRPLDGLDVGEQLCLDCREVGHEVLERGRLALDHPHLEDVVQLSEVDAELARRGLEPAPPLR